MNNYSSLLEKVKALIHSRAFTDASNICNTTLLQQELDESTRCSFLYYLGMSHFLENRFTESIDCFKSALAINPRHTDSAIALSVIYNDIGKYDEAKAIYQIANQSLQFKKAGSDQLLDVKFSIKHIELGDMYFKFHRYDEALDDYSKALRLDPQHKHVRIKIAKVYSKKGFYSRAVQELQQLCHENENFTDARTHLGLMYFSQGNVIDARIEWERVLKSEPDNKEVRMYLGMANQATETSS